MRVFVDSNVFIYSYTNTVYAEPCRRILRLIGHGDVDGVSSVFVAEEIWHVERSGPLRIPAGAMRLALEVFDHIVPVDMDIIAAAMALTDVPGSLGTADRVHAATCRSLGIVRILSADSAFDGIPWLQRIDPIEENVAAL